MNLLKTRVCVIRNTSTKEYLTEFKTPMIHYPTPKMTWGSLDDAMLFNSGSEVREFIHARTPLASDAAAGKIKLISIPVELHIEKVVNITGTMK